MRNADQRDAANVAVTVETKPRGQDAAVAFGPAVRGAGARRTPTRPIWVLDEGPIGGDIATVNTWSAGALRARRGAGADVEARAEQGRHLHDRLPRRPRPHGQGPRRRAAGPAAASPSSIADEPVPARVGGDGGVERGVERPVSVR